MATVINKPASPAETPNVSASNGSIGWGIYKVLKDTTVAISKTTRLRLKIINYDLIRIEYLQCSFGQAGVELYFLCEFNA